jgi:hypothetical protein
VPATRALLFLGLLFFLAALAALWRVLEGGARPLWPGLALLGLSVATLGLAAWRLHTRIDFDRIMDEQRLWESGPLGRLWLRIRRR